MPDRFVAERFVAIVPSDSVNFVNGPCWSILCGTAGAASVVSAEGVTLTIPLQQGYNPIRCIRVNATGTTAANLVALY